MSRTAAKPQRRKGKGDIVISQLLRAAILSAATTGGVAAQETTRPPETATVRQSDSATPSRTGKERLGPKWSDEQRLDNCNVPPERRGSQPRPDECRTARKD